MPTLTVLRVACATLLLGGVAGPAWAEQAATPAASPSIEARSPFTRGSLGIEFAATVATESWNSNGNHEWVTDATFSVWWAFRQNMSLVVEFHAAPIFQDRPRTAFVTGFSPMFRWRMVERGPTSLFIDAGAGVAWSDTTVPPRGTRFNFLIITSIGMTRQLTRQTSAVASFRLIHVSNAGREGRDRNPDIEALGGYFGFCVSF